MTAQLRGPDAYIKFDRARESAWVADGIPVWVEVPQWRASQ
jgi:hypothetical protein